MDAQRKVNHFLNIASISVSITVGVDIISRVNISDDVCELKSTFGKQYANKVPTSSDTRHNYIQNTSTHLENVSTNKFGQIINVFVSLSGVWCM